MTVFIIVGSSSYPYETSSHLTKVGSMLSLSPKGVGKVSRWIIHLLNIKTNERDSHIQYVPTLCMDKEFEMDNLSLPTIHQFKTWNRYQKLHGNKLYFCNLLVKRHEERDVLQTFFLERFKIAELCAVVASSFVSFYLLCEEKFLGAVNRKSF